MEKVICYSSVDLFPFVDFSPIVHSSLELGLVPTSYYLI